MKYTVYYKNGHITQFEGNFKLSKSDTEVKIIGEDKRYIIPIDRVDKVVSGE